MRGGNVNESEGEVEPSRHLDPVPGQTGRMLRRDVGGPLRHYAPRWRGSAAVRERDLDARAQPLDVESAEGPLFALEQ